MSLLKERQLSVYQCAKEIHVPYTTLSDIVKGKTRIEKCTVETIYKLARTLHVTMEELLTDFFNEDENTPAEINRYCETLIESVRLCV